MSRFFACPVCAKNKIQIPLVTYGDIRSCPFCGSNFNIQHQISFF